MNEKKIEFNEQTTSKKPPHLHINTLLAHQSPLFTSETSFTSERQLTLESSVPRLILQSSSQHAWLEVVGTVSLDRRQSRSSSECWDGLHAATMDQCFCGAFGPASSTIATNDPACPGFLQHHWL